MFANFAKHVEIKNNAYKKNKSKASENKEKNRNESLPNEFQEITTENKVIKVKLNKLLKILDSYKIIEKEQFLNELLL